MRVVLCNCSPTEADSLAKTLVEERVAACVNILPGVRSVYFWEGSVQEGFESTLIIKVSENGVEALRKRLVEIHSYDVVEVLSLPVVESESDPRYISWVKEVTRQE